MDSVTSTAMKMRGKASPAVFRAVIYIVAFVTGAIVMSFEMLGSRYLNPYFGNGIYTWAALISMVLAALTAGYFLGGLIADRTVSAAVLGTIVSVASVYLLMLPSFADAIAKGDEQKKAEIERVKGLFSPVDNDFLEVMRATDENTVCLKFGCSVLTVSQLKNLIENEITKRKDSEHKREVARQDTINMLIAIGTGVAALVSLIGLWFSWRGKEDEREGQDGTNQKGSTNQTT